MLQCIRVSRVHIEHIPHKSINEVTVMHAVESIEYRVSHFLKGQTHRVVGILVYGATSCVTSCLIAPFAIHCCPVREPDVTRAAWLDN